jgi:hypothetical protein
MGKEMLITTRKIKELVLVPAYSYWNIMQKNTSTLKIRYQMDENYFYSQLWIEEIAGEYQVWSGKVNRWIISPEKVRRDNFY